VQVTEEDHSPRMVEVETRGIIQSAVHLLFAVTAAVLLDIVAHAHEHTHKVGHIVFQVSFKIQLSPSS
jgi:hypothetical protein